MAEPNTTPPVTEPTPEPEVFTKDYVHTLREEAKNNRIKAKELEDKLTAIETEKETAKRQKLEAENKFKELNETLKTENETLKTKVGEVTTLTEKLSALETERRNELLELLTDEHKEFAKDLPLEKLPAYVKLHKDTKIGVDGGRSGAFTFTIDGKKWDDFTSKELEEIQKKNPNLYDTLKKQKYK
jgi:chromosome segregation ATPase